MFINIYNYSFLTRNAFLQFSISPVRYSQSVIRLCHLSPEYIYHPPSSLPFHCTHPNPGHRYLIRLLQQLLLPVPAFLHHIAASVVCDINQTLFLQCKTLFLPIT